MSWRSRWLVAHDLAACHLVNIEGTIASTLTALPLWLFSRWLPRAFGVATITALRSPQRRWPWIALGLPG